MHNLIGCNWVLYNTVKTCKYFTLRVFEGNINEKLFNAGYLISVDSINVHVCTLVEELETASYSLQMCEHPNYH